MRYYKSFILFSLLALVFVACDTDDLEKDIDALKDRVASVEAQVQRLNDEMNILRVALDGNKTITDYSIDGDTYTLTLSNILVKRILMQCNAIFRLLARCCPV